MIYVTPTEDNLYQTSKMKSHGIFSEVYQEVGEIIVADLLVHLAEDAVRLHLRGLVQVVLGQTSPDFATAAAPVRRGRRRRRREIG
ncbi:hypothetical protein MAHJHV59_47720 [Mycobacterium avium subsp. hominissuis]